MAELVAHLAEVEERRLHLEAAYGSLFDYCVRRLHMSEDWRGSLAASPKPAGASISVLFPLLASGELTLSAALVLKPVLTSNNHLELIEAARRKSMTPTKAPASASPPSSSPASPATHIARATRRAVVERDGLACTWVDASGTRCNSRAWLELDHRQPRGKGGESNAGNVRGLCRAHNHLAAERAYGRTHIERAKAARQAFKRRAPSEHGALTREANVSEGSSPAPPVADPRCADTTVVVRPEVSSAPYG